MSNNELSIEDSVESISGIGDVRANKLSAETVGELAKMKAIDVKDELGSISVETVNRIVNDARDATSIRMKDANLSPTNEMDSAGTAMPEEAISGTTDEELEAEVDAFMDDDEDDAVDDQLDAFLDDDDEEVEINKVLLVAGEDLFSAGGKHAEMSQTEQAELVATRIVQFGIDPAALTGIGGIRNSAGKTAVDSWVFEMDAEQRPADLRAFSPNFDEFDEYKEAYADMRTRAAEWADAVVVFENGEYVGAYVNAALDVDETEIYSPDEE